MLYTLITYIPLKDWLEKQQEREEDLLDAAAEQFRKVLDELLPQVRLAALENDMESEIEVLVVFAFEDEATTITTEARVRFPAKISEAESVTI